MNRTIYCTDEEYENLSKIKELPLHCPYADDYKCLRYLLTRQMNGDMKDIEQNKKIILHNWSDIDKNLEFLPLPNMIYKDFEDPIGGNEFNESKNLHKRVDLCPEVFDGHAVLIEYHYPLPEWRELRLDVQLGYYRKIKRIESMHYSDCDFFKFLHQHDLEKSAQTNDVTQQTEPPDQNTTRFEVCDDEYRRIRWRTSDSSDWQIFTFSHQQADIVKILHEASDNMMRNNILAKKMGKDPDDFRIDKIFKGTGAYSSEESGTLICIPLRGYRGLDI